MAERSAIQEAADDIDCNLFRLLSRVEMLAQQHQRNPDVRLKLRAAASDMRSARAEIRCLMHPEDTAKTI